MRYKQIKAAQPDKQAGEFQAYDCFFSFFWLGEPLKCIAILRWIS